MFLKVDDGLETNWAPVTIIVSGDSSTNTAPIANAGADQDFCSIDSVSLDGSASLDPDGDAISYEWVFRSTPEGSSLVDADISGASTSTPSFTPDSGGTYQITLTVSDTLDTDSATVSVTLGDPSLSLLLHFDETS